MESTKLNNGFKFIEVLIIVIITSLFSIFAGISYGRLKYSKTIYMESDSVQYEMSPKLKEFVENYLYIINNYYDKNSIDEDKLLNGALESVVEELGINDNHSVYMGKGDYKNFNINLAGEYTGFGFVTAKGASDDYIFIIGILEDTPSDKVDIKVGDIILSIDGKETKKMTQDDFNDYVISSKEKNFALKIKRDNKIKVINIKKETIEIKSVISKVVEKDKKKIGYIYISIFANNTYSQFKKNLQELEKQNIDGLIIDLRDNSGGHLTTVNKILNLFLDKDKIIYKLKTNESTEKYYSSGDKDYELPIVFISNDSTASSSEIMIYALKENIGAKVVGVKTYGKGTVQEMVGLTNGDKYKITTKKWLSPKGKWVNDTRGIEPDYKEKLSDKYDNDPTEKNDNQYQKALEIILKEIKSK